MSDVHTEQPASAADAGPPADAPRLNADQQAGVALLEEVCAASGQDVRPVARSVQGGYLYIELVGEDVRATWGRLGYALDSLQLLCNLILARRVRGEVRIILDADGYRERRAEALIRRAQELAEEVKRRNEEAELEPLPPHERRIIHTALVDDPEITTYSEGDEPNRRIVISPRR